MIDLCSLAQTSDKSVNLKSVVPQNQEFPRRSGIRETETFSERLTFGGRAAGRHFIDVLRK